MMPGDFFIDSIFSRITLSTLRTVRRLFFAHNPEEGEMLHGTEMSTRFEDQVLVLTTVDERKNLPCLLEIRRRANNELRLGKLEKPLTWSMMTCVAAIWLLVIEHTVLRWLWIILSEAVFWILHVKVGVRITKDAWDRVVQQMRELRTSPDVEMLLQKIAPYDGTLHRLMEESEAAHDVQR